MNSGQRCYRLVYDGLSFFLEADSFDHAVDKWHAAMLDRAKRAQPDDFDAEWDGEEVPDELHIEHNGSVISGGAR